MFVQLRTLYQCGKSRKFLLYSFVADCTTCALAFLAAIVFGSKVQTYSNVNPHFGFIFNALGGVLFSLSAGCFLVEYCCC